VRSVRGAPQETALLLLPELALDLLVPLVGLAQAVRVGAIWRGCARTANVIPTAMIKHSQRHPLSKITTPITFTAIANA
jgi:hypothetical protein